MLLRRDEHGVLAIGQPSHAWISGQLALAWGNERFGAVEPREEVCLAAGQHDIGMAEWDLEPTFNPQTGLPHSFIEMPLEVHIELWGGAARRLIRQSRYAALLTSMHGVRLYELRDSSKLDAADAERVTAFFAAQRALQERLKDSLQADRGTAYRATDALIRRGSDLLWAWDYLSLALCLGWAPCSATDVPTAGGATELSLTPTRASVEVDPWPFAADHVEVHCEGQRLAERYANENELRRALTAAPWETFSIELVPEDRSA
jgi:hypothetical protein